MQSATRLHFTTCFLLIACSTGKPLNVSNAFRAVNHCSRWYVLGVLLDVKVETLDNIRISRREEPSPCMIAMLDAWLKGNVNASWRQLADALKDMDELRSSRAVEKYCPATHKPHPL